jgi:Zn-dependent alcohol dehydrogenase
MRMRAAVLESFGEPLAVQDLELDDRKGHEVLVHLVASHELALDDVNRGFELLEAQDGIRSVIRFA